VFSLSSVAARSPDWLAGLAAGCDRLVHPAIVDAAERGRQARLAGLLLGGPLLTAAAAAQLLMPSLGAAAALAMICAVLAGGWLSVLLIHGTGRIGSAYAAYGAAVPLTSILIAAAGGLQSPFALIVAAFVFEPAWIRRDLKAMPAGLAAATAVLVGQHFFAIAMAAAETPSAWHWLVPAIYVASLVLRGKLLRDEAAAPQEAPEAAVEDMFDMAVFGIAGNGDVVDFRGPVRRLFGLPAEMLLATGLFERLHVADRVAYLSAVADMREGASARRLELRLRAPGAGAAARSGTYHPYAVEMVRSDKADAPVTAMFRNGAEAADMRARLVASRDAADGGEVARNRFIAIVSHELRTPLNAIIGFSDMLLGDMAGPFADRRQRDYVGLIRESGGHLLSLVNTILDMSKIESGAYEIRPEPFRLGDAVEMARSMLAFQAEAKGITLVQSVAPGTGEVKADRRAVSQMLINLVANAVKFTPAGGKVTIGARRLGSRALFWVSDTGIGIAEADMQQLGRPFAQIQNDYTRQFEGTGLGLAVVKGLVALHKGTMTIESAEGEGTIVTISLPADGPAGRGEALANMTEEAIHGTLRKTA
jgi:two-component system, cell cycle sensor histidine kinase DivJ